MVDAPVTRPPEHGALGGAEDADPVDAVVLVEALVLGREEGLDDGGRDLVERHHGAALEAQIGDESAVGRVHLGGLGGIVLAERVEGRAGVAAADREPGRQHDGDAEGQDTEDSEDNGTDDARRAPAGRAGGSRVGH